METFGFYKDIKTCSDKAKRACPKLHNLYNKIPDTKGCMDNISKIDGCKGWCCNFQSPQLLYGEFLNLWNYIMQNWEIEQICNVIEKSLKNYIMGITTKGCIFFNAETKMCEVHKKRPFNCRIYGITPEEEFAPRLEKMKTLYKNDPRAVIKDQCDLVETVNGETVTKEDIDIWWNELINIERGIGILQENINDDMGGSYRTPHDHVLLYTMPDFVMEELQKIRLIDNYSEKIQIIERYMEAVRGSM